ncbi:MAG: acylphosphatase [Chloroflexia bacterium]|nr:acylphosphatase [Chloroflexia bacterium]
MSEHAGTRETVAHWTITVTGDVQGVFFRQSARERALALGLSGEARNMPDGSVRIEVEGPVDQLERFRVWCEQGPERAEVAWVAISEGPVRGYPRGQFHRR